MARGGGLTVLLIATLITSACTGHSDSTDSGPAHVTLPPRQQVTWVQETTIPDIQPGSVTTDPLTGVIYLGGSLPAATSSEYHGPLIKGGTRKPVLWERDAEGRWHEGAVKVTSFYGAQATLASISAYQHVVALGAVAGGAHANPRPSFFVGSSAGLAEHEQNFYTWGGENAIGIVGMAAGPDEQLMVGQWAPDGHRASGALWTSADGHVYVRHDVVPGLGDSLGGKRTTAPLAAAYADGRFVVVGFVTDLTKPGLSIAPAVWISDGLTVQPGSLPAAAGELGGPSDLACRASSCLAAGMLTVSGHQQLTAWRIAVTGQPASQAAGTRLDLSACPAPPAAADPGSSTPRAPVVHVAIGADGTGWVVAGTSRTGVVCRVAPPNAAGAAGRGRTVTLPEGCAPTAVESPGAGAIELICTRPDAAGATIWRAS